MFSYCVWEFFEYIWERRVIHLKSSFGPKKWPEKCQVFYSFFWKKPLFILPRGIIPKSGGRFFGHLRVWLCIHFTLKNQCTSWNHFFLWNWMKLMKKICQFGTLGSFLENFWDHFATLFCDYAVNSYFQNPNKFRKVLIKCL